MQGSGHSDGGTGAGVTMAGEGARLWWQALVGGGAEERNPEAVAPLGEGGIRELQRPTGESSDLLPPPAPSSSHCFWWFSFSILMGWTLPPPAEASSDQSEAGGPPEGARERGDRAGAQGVSFCCDLGMNCC
ncbi:hypothetical protein NL676_000336 [Syzygium grande]|nr:hypothetical protein NL676_000336 [Syzygium grande]